MPSEAEKQVQAFEVIARDVVAPAALSAPTALRAEAWVTLEPVPLDAARRARYRFVTPGRGWQWGPAWATCGVRGRIAPSAGRRAVAALRSRVPWSLRFSTGTEALLWVDGVPRESFGLARSLVPLTRDAMRELHGSGLMVEAACNHPLGVSGMAWAYDATHAG